MIDDAALKRLKQAVGPKGWTDDPEDLSGHLREWRDLYEGAAPVMLMPASTGDVAAIVGICAENRIPIVPQAGNTGLCGASIPDSSGDQILVNFSRLHRVRDIDPDNYTLTAESGCILADLQQAARDAGRYFPLSMASEGSARLGGFLSTNAGGVNVLHYGNARDLVLGLEVVLADGTIWDGLTGLRKDNTGYDLKHLFIGAEGTLGLITAAVLKLFPKPASSTTALLAIDSPAAAIQLLGLAREKSGDLVTAFELMPRIGLDFVLKHGERVREPLAERHPWYVLMDLSSGLSQAILDGVGETIFEAAFEANLVRDGVLATNEAQAAELWRLRHAMSESQKPEGGSIKHDISVPVSAIATFIARATAAVTEAIPGCRPVPFGHVGDGNVHFNISQPEGGDKAAFLAEWARVNDIVHAIVAEMGGSISAEHGIGVLKRDVLPRYKSPEALALMRRIKRDLDPENIMNPGKVLGTE